MGAATKLCRNIQEKSLLIACINSQMLSTDGVRVIAFSFRTATTTAIAATSSLLLTKGKNCMSTTEAVMAGWSPKRLEKQGLESALTYESTLDTKMPW